MTELDRGKTVSLQELMVSTLAMVDAVTKLLIEKGVISEAEFAQNLFEERAVYQRLLNPTVQLTSAKVVRDRVRVIRDNLSFNEGRN